MAHNIVCPLSYERAFCHHLKNALLCKSLLSP
nr:MAG TPA: hypothetical protein [Caudoviricetes sp.]